MKADAVTNCLRARRKIDFAYQARSADLVFIHSFMHFLFDSRGKGEKQSLSSLTRTMSASGAFCL